MFHLSLTVMCAGCLWFFKMNKFVFQLSDKSKERKVPVTRVSRMMNFGGEW